MKKLYIPKHKFLVVSALIMVMSGGLESPTLLGLGFCIMQLPWLYEDIYNAIKKNKEHNDTAN